MRERLRAHLGRRATGVIVTVLLEALILLAIWTLGESKEEPKFKEEIVSTFDTGDETKEPEPEKKETPEQQTRQPTDIIQQPVPQPAVQPVPLPQPLPLPPVSISIKPAPPAAPAPASKGVIKPGAPVYGPPNTGGTSGDSKRVGTGPDGKPIYAVSWYKRPGHEVDGYFQTASPPGWGEILCKTAPENKVVNCTIYDEYPDHSNMARALLAASWQLQVRPARVGGRSLYGTWVLIHYEITYDKPKPAP